MPVYPGALKYIPHLTLFRIICFPREVPGKEAFARLSAGSSMYANGSIADMAESSSSQQFVTTLDLVMYITFLPTSPLF